MELSLEDAAREHLAAFLAQQVTIDEFKSWLVAATWNQHEDTASSGMRFANEIKLALAEHSGGFRSDAELREILTELLNRSLVETR
jgi:hypothetical protein